MAAELGRPDPPVAAKTEETPPSETPKTPESAPADGQTPPEESKTAAEPDPVDDKGKQRVSPAVQRRIDQLTREKHDRDREIEALRAKLNGSENKPAPASAAATDQAQPEAEPTRENFQSDAEYYKALGAFGAREEIRKAEERRAAERIREAEAKAQEVTEAAFETVRERHKDFDKASGVFFAAGFAKEVLAQLQADEDGVEFLYRVGSDPQEAAVIAALEPLDQLRAFRKIQAELSRGREKPTTNAAPTKSKPVSEAPDPIPPSRGANGTGLAFDPKLAPIDDPGWEKWRAERTKAQFQ